MKEGEKRYAMGRVKEALRDKLEALKKTLTKPPGKPSDKDLLKILEDSLDTWQVEVKKRITMDSTLREAFRFKIVETGPVIDQDAYGKEAEKVRSKAAKITDEIMLGDEAKAKQLLDEFCNN